MSGRKAAQVFMAPSTPGPGSGSGGRPTQGCSTETTPSRPAICPIAYRPSGPPPVRCAFLPDLLIRLGAAGASTRNRVGVHLSGSASVSSEPSP